MSASTRLSAPARTAETMQRSAPSVSRTSTNCLSQRFRTARSVRSPGSGRTWKRGAIPAESSATAARPCWSACGRSPGSRCGSRFMKQVCIVSPWKNPPARWRTPNSSPIRNGSTGSIPPSRSPIADFAITSGRFRSSPSRSRARRCSSALPSGERSTQTSPSCNSTGNTRASSAHWSNVPPVVRSNRAWCQWQVRIPSCTVPRWRGKPMCGHRLSTATTRSPSAKSASVWPSTCATREPSLRTSSRAAARSMRRA